MAQKYEVREVEVYPNTQGSERTFELADDEEILDSEWRNAHRLVVAIASPTTADRCMALTSDGSRCQHAAKDDSDFCQIPSHGGSE